MKKLLLLVTFLLPLGARAACTVSGNTYTAASASFADVKACTDLIASDGITVEIPAGTQTWSAQALTFACFALTLHGAGAGVTVITSTGSIGAVNQGCANKEQRISNIQWINNGTSSTGLFFTGGTSGGPWSFRIDHCLIEDNAAPGTGSYHRFMWVEGPVVQGGAVIDHTTIYNQGIMVSAEVAGAGNDGSFNVPGTSTPCGNADNCAGATQWNKPMNGLDNGSAVYFENDKIIFNAFFNNDFLDCQNGGRYVFRFSEVDDQVIFNHGFDSVASSCIESSAYWNVFKKISNSNQLGVLYRGGSGLVYNNQMTGSQTKVWMTYYRANNSGNNSCPQGYAQNHITCGSSGPGAWCGFGNSADGSGTHNYPCFEQPGRGSGANQWLGGANTYSYPIYTWDNCPSNTGGGCTPGGTQIVPSVFNNNGGSIDYTNNDIVNNQDYYNSISPFTGATGVGVGAFSARPSTCTTGTAYWASDIDKLYQCTSTNTWTLYYTPYQYPHPLVAAQPAPAIYTDLYSQLDGDLTDFSAAIPSGSNTVTWAGQLTLANSNNGPALLTSLSIIQEQILLLKAEGVKAVSVEVSFPMLNSNFLENFVQTGYQAQFVTFYAAVAAAIRAQGMLVIVESQSMIPNGLNSGFGTQLGNYYPTLNWTQYKAARALTAVTVAQTMTPDYFVLQEEPDTEAGQSGQTNAGTVAGSMDMATSTLAAVTAAAVPGVKYGAGFGAWLESFQGFANGFTHTSCSVPQPGTQPCIQGTLDFMDFHLFPIIENATQCHKSGGGCSVPNFWQNSMNVVATAIAAGYHMTISQTWLRKVRDAEWAVLSGGGGIEEAREAYSFWSPLDQRSLLTVYNLARYQGMFWAAPFNTQNYTGYLTWNGATNSIINDCYPTYTGCGVLSTGDVFQKVQTLARTNMGIASYTDTGLYWHSLIAPGDTTPPTTPTGLSTTPGTTTMQLNWTPSTDAVGVAGYHVFRNATPVANVFLSTYLDTGLTPSTSYTYNIYAFDLAGNVSSPGIITSSTNSGGATPLSISGIVHTSGSKVVFKP